MVAERASGTDETDAAENETGSAENKRDGDEGTYTLVVELKAPAAIDVGALGPIDLAAGWYAYTGSAFGPGGFGRVERHRELAAGERDTRHWHVDYLLCHPDAAVEYDRRTPGVDIECSVSRGLDGERVPDFGASDCDCDSHLVYSADRERLLAAVERAHDRFRDISKE